ncbi:MAG TPA: hypothetical protein VFL92_01385 [Sphingomonas sp.]|nr:hypothetical protein [Sphingomonas sp.]
MVWQRGDEGISVGQSAGAAALCDMLPARMRGEEVASVQMPPRLVVRGSSARD